jgi:hypothetical protein
MFSILVLAFGVGIDLVQVNCDSNFDLEKRKYGIKYFHPILQFF